jgi:hypothetical protein
MQDRLARVATTATASSSTPIDAHRLIYGELRRPGTGGARTRLQVLKGCLSRRLWPGITRGVSVFCPAVFLIDLPNP